MKRNTSFARNLISNYEGSPQIQKIELKRQKKNFALGQAIDDYNLKKGRQHSFQNNSSIHNSSYNILNTSNYNTNNSNISVQNYNNKTSRTKPPLSSIPVQKYKQRGPDSQIINTGENILLNLLEITSYENDKALLFKFRKNNNETDIDSILFKLGTIRINLLAKYISTCLSVISDYRTILNHPIIKSIEKDENSILIQKQLLNMKIYIYNFIKKLPENKKNEQIKEYYKYLEKEIELGKKLGVDSDSYEINYLFNFFPKGIEIICDYDMLEIVYYNSKKNNKISGKALLPPPEFCFKLDPDKIAIKFFDFEFDIEDLDDIKLIMSQIWKIIQEKLKVAKLFIEPCLSQVRIELENKEREKDKEIENTIKNKDNKYRLIENIKLKNNINSLNTKTNTTEITLTNNINEIKTMDNKNINIIGKKNYTYTTINVNNNIIKNIEKHLISNKTKNNDININNNNIENNEKRIKLDTKKIVLPLMNQDKENIEDKDKKTNSKNEGDNDVKNVLDDLDDEKSQLTENKNEFFKEDNFGSKDMNISDDINEKKL